MMITEAEYKPVDDLRHVRVDADRVVAGVNAAELHEEHVDGGSHGHHVNAFACRSACAQWPKKDQVSMTIPRRSLDLERIHWVSAMSLIAKRR